MFRFLFTKDVCGDRPISYLIAIAAITAMWVAAMFFAADKGL